MASDGKECEGTLVALASCNDDQECDKNCEFTKDHLTEVSADDVLAWFNCCACGTPTLILTRVRDWDSLQS